MNDATLWKLINARLSLESAREVLNDAVNGSDDIEKREHRGAVQRAIFGAENALHELSTVLGDEAQQ